MRKMENLEIDYEGLLGKTISKLTIIVGIKHYIHLPEFSTLYIGIAQGVSLFYHT